MLESSCERILRGLSGEAVVLDIGGWASPFPRADWVLDIMPYETRGLYGKRVGEERFGPDTWIQRDICGHEPYPFADDEVDFIVCSHTLEDVGDPVWVCSEMIRIGKAGYIEVPSRLDEQTYGFRGAWVGWGHHRWLVDIANQTWSSCSRVTRSTDAPLHPSLPSSETPSHLKSGYRRSGGRAVSRIESDFFSKRRTSRNTSRSSWSAAFSNAGSRARGGGAD